MTFDEVKSKYKRENYRELYHKIIPFFWKATRGPEIADAEIIQVQCGTPFSRI